MTYDPFDTNENDSTADANVEMDSLQVNGSTTGLTPVVQTVQSQADLPAVDPPQVFYIASDNIYVMSTTTRGYVTI